MYASHQASSSEPAGTVGAEKLTALFAAKTKGQVSGDIEKLLAAGAKKPVASAPHTPTPHAKRAPAEKASEKQVALVMRLVRRGDWFDKFDGLRQPTESEVRSMSKAKVSRLINELTSDY